MEKPHIREHLWDFWRQKRLQISLALPSYVLPLNFFFASGVWEQFDFPATAASSVTVVVNIVMFIVALFKMCNLVITLVPL